MFVSIKDKISTVQEGINASFRGLSVNTSPLSKPSAGTVFVKSAVNVNAGADVLHHYQVQWNELHKLAEKNATKAKDVDSFIEGIHKRIQNEWNSISNLYNNLYRLDQISKEMDSLFRDIGSLDKMVLKVENMVIELEDVIEMQKLQESQLEQRFKLAMHREMKLSQLDSVRAHLSSDHATKLAEHERKKELVRKERQAAFGDAFQNDIDHFNKYGSIPLNKSVALDSSISLEDVELDVDQEALNELLDD